MRKMTLVFFPPAVLKLISTTSPRARTHLCTNNAGHVYFFLYLYTCETIGRLERLRVKFYKVKQKKKKKKENKIKTKSIQNFYKIARIKLSQFLFVCALCVSVRLHCGPVCVHTGGMLCGRPGIHSQRGVV